ncbi:MAG: nucleoside monophosphate kinase [Holosporales bacterium]|jgi:adenylate kinase|nr:nucleoside monophosphate kinase [Holosporales bacterium]
MWVIFLGPPGCGKGSQAACFVEKYGYSTICAGDLLRENRDRVIDKEGNTIGSVITSGYLLPDHVTTSVVSEKMNEVHGKNIIFDGFPRTIMQVRALENLAESFQKKVNCVINFTIDEDTVLKRISGRYQCATCARIYNKYFLSPQVEGICDGCGGTTFIQRSDDNEEALMKRLKEYNGKTYPLIDFYSRSGILYNVNADAPFDVVTEDVIDVLKKEEIS